jgi:hypothetical protein
MPNPECEGSRDRQGVKIEKEGRLMYQWALRLNLIVLDASSDTGLQNEI